MIQDIKTVMHLLKKYPYFFIFYFWSMNLQISHM